MTVAQVPSPYYQHVIARGLPYERGLAHGQQAAQKVRDNVAYYKTPGKLAKLETMELIIKEIYIPNIAAHYPAGLEEMRGIADGAHVSLEDVVLLNARYDLARLNEDDQEQSSITNGADGVNGNHYSRSERDDLANECTSAIFFSEATATGDVLNAQNWDMSARLWLHDTIIYLEVHPDPSEAKPSLFLVTEAGQLGRSGINSLGMAVTANSLMSTEDYCPSTADPKPVMPISMLRRMVLESAHFAEATTAIYNFPRHVSNNLTVATADGFGMCFEITPTREYKVYADLDDHYLVHSNHFTHTAFLARPDAKCRYPGGSSWFRRQRLEQNVRPYKNGLVTVEQLQRAFADHLSFPESLCCHPDRSPDAVIGQLPGYPFRSSSATVASVTYNLTQRTITVCKGPPCQGTFQTFQLSGPLSIRGLGPKSRKLAAAEDIKRPETP
ncbi:peptidase C45 acyl-coenzyme A:6-aminopenicillanic acid acyl-transferase [Cordyceps fumosorosea ARSEF 2679]|uniref:Peptidase C45 acyl-coenzyme A:6-aminopenicillanic acid acyl-transferase n=1 Tax=Cordyceps fumosorosea (strain ARSEF 2679) TaxID=1081104 RepID=A0A162MSM0_CORFA|nr:peptidase C45 acyl-coenzyme A:6-aminopenicillanic acid acyl-transferase [Cordyceps fumosorosea ARSEF 2679]OAA66320.1 peptidase C45 acyl-coenzyme A:6-aminopenicillanic acid acyl-transferase [Cordyceps fumosorosea ARSEF 2679]